MLTITNISKRFGTHQANNDITLSIESGRIFGLLGPNGAGKTTLIRMITNIIMPDEGEIRYEVIFKEIDRLGYAGWVGCEYKPRASVEEGLKWVAAMGLSL